METTSADFWQHGVPWCCTIKSRVSINEVVGFDEDKRKNQQLHLDASVVFLVDVSGSIRMDDISEWVYEISKFFLLVDDGDSRPDENDFSIMSRIKYV